MTGCFCLEGPKVLGWKGKTRVSKEAARLRKQRGEDGRKSKGKNEIITQKLMEDGGKCVLACFALLCFASFGTKAPIQCTFVWVRPIVPMQPTTDTRGGAISLEVEIHPMTGCLSSMRFQSKRPRPCRACPPSSFPPYLISSARRRPPLLHAFCLFFLSPFPLQFALELDLRALSLSPAGILRPSNQQIQKRRPSRPWATGAPS